MQINCEHIAANCNPMPQTLQFVNTDLIAFCFKNQVGLYNVKQNRVIKNINNRALAANRANCLKTVNYGEKVFILVGYDNGYLCLYQNTEKESWSLQKTIKQSSAITCIYHLQEYLITINTNAEVQIYRIDGDKENLVSEFDKINFPLNKTPDSVSAFSQNDILILFIGGVDQKIHCYTKQKQKNIEYRFSLSGHQNAITKLAIIQQDNNYLLASSSKDGYIRLWKITKNIEEAKFHKNVKNLLEDWKVFLDSVLINHQSSVTNLCWVKFGGVTNLASCSLDCTICLWGHEGQQAWSVDSRLGQFIGNKNAYFNITTDPQNRYLVAVNYIGSAMIWTYNSQTNKFILRPSFNGHFNQVKDIDWNYSGDFLVSVSMDQTTRIISHNQQTNHYHEISRAQIHGYDINAVSTIKIDDNIIDLVACGADEKVIRIVEPPASFANLLNSATKANLHLYFPSKEQQNKYKISKDEDPVLLYQTYQEGGTQVLGLMTKVQKVERQKITSYYDDEEEQAEQAQEKQEEVKQSKINFEVPPHDDYLVKHTLWPEMNKLYGHPHEISCLAKSNSRKLLASSCFGLTKVACSIIIWDIEQWKIHKIIEHHNFSVYDMKFSNCSNYFGSVSKDRKLAVFNKDFELQFGYEAHSRAINCLAFSPDSKFIITGSRDKTIKIHSLEQKKQIYEIPMKRQVYSLQFCSDTLLAAGLDNGSIIFIKKIDGNWNIIKEVQDQFGHTEEITKLRWSKGRLASSSKDHSVRIFSIKQE